MKVLIIPSTYPYDDGLFLFEFKFGPNYPMNPPEVTFYPKQNYARLHPNFYELGKICLSVINTWGDDDWTPSMSILSIISILEARFDSKSLCYEPGRERALQKDIDDNNQVIQFAKYLLICDILEKKHQIYEDFYQIIKEYHNNIITKVKNLNINYCIKAQTTYHHTVYIDYKLIIERLHRIYANTNINTNINTSTNTNTNTNTNTSTSTNV